MANAMLAVNFVPNKFGRVRLEQNGYQYMVKTTRGDRRYWKCIVPLCPATINTHYDTVTKNANHHSHPASTIRVKAEAVLNIMRERCMKETTPNTNNLRGGKGKVTQLRVYGSHSRSS
ncbi:Hypothetical predicted protein [Mytilus galloprovincialis]|uniref:FLYWCH-type domain-containing protein n=1 Tax=Mytilus galloprovincialis TaxID=29158 RepID=A0A8B6BNE2_MYTGA|nr:Hypothetical predicted protein [Mytilus galloprovincialis]